MFNSCNKMILWLDEHYIKKGGEETKMEYLVKEKYLHFKDLYFHFRSRPTYRELLCKLYHLYICLVKISRSAQRRILLLWKKAQWIHSNYFFHSHNTLIKATMDILFVGAEFKHIKSYPKHTFLFMFYSQGEFSRTSVAGAL